MAGLYRFLDSYEPLIYIVLGLGALFSFRWLWVSWREWQQSVFRLEREFSLRRMSQAFAISLLVVILFCAEFVAASFIIPGLPAQVFIPTPTLNLLALPAGTVSPELMTQIAAASPASPAANMEGCVPGQLIITSPKLASTNTRWRRAVEIPGQPSRPPPSPVRTARWEPGIRRPSLPAITSCGSSPPTTRGRRCLPALFPSV
jgi:hypothetical protein